MAKQQPMYYPKVEPETNMYSSPVLFLPTTLSTEQDDLLDRENVKSTDIP